MSLHLVMMNRRIKSTFRLMPEMLRRIEAFEDDNWTAELAAAFEESFCRDSFAMFGLAVVDDSGTMRGHLVAGIETFAGSSQAVVYQLAKDKGFDDGPAETMSQIEDLVKVWAQAAGKHLNLRISNIIFLVKDRPRERLFASFGYEPGPRLMRKGL